MFLNNLNTLTYINIYKIIYFYTLQLFIRLYLLKEVKTVNIIWILIKLMNILIKIMKYNNL